MLTKGLIAINDDPTAIGFEVFPTELINTRMKEVLVSNNSEIDSILAYLTENNGKMIRPRLVTIAASMGACIPKVVIDIAVAVELIHLASLIHDDVIDHAMIRRGRESLNSRWGNHASILTGDYLFASAFYLINVHGKQDVMENITSTIRTMCAGEIKQMSLAGNLDITEDQYYLKNYGKTACLFASSCKVGALAGSMSSQAVNALDQFGLYLGHAYQILDDILDYVSDSSLLGKPVGTDLKEGNITLPIILALKSARYGGEVRKQLENPDLTQEQIMELIDILVESKAIEASVDTAWQFITGGLQHLDTLPDSASRKQLQNMAVYLWDTYSQKLSFRNQSKLSHWARVTEAGPSSTRLFIAQH